MKSPHLEAGNQRARKPRVLGWMCSWVHRSEWHKHVQPELSHALHVRIQGMSGSIDHAVSKNNFVRLPKIESFYEESAIKIRK